MTFQINDITLYKSGIGFFNGVCKEKEFILPVNEDVVDDILKSLSIESLRSVTFSAAEIKDDIQRKIGINIDSENAFLSFGRHLIGLDVEIATDNQYSGIVVGVDYILIDDEDGVDKGIDVLVLKQGTIITHIPISKITHLKILNETIKKDLDIFLNLEATTRKTGVTNLKIFTEKDNAAIQWVSPVSAWRLSYRVQFDEETKKANFTGIAIVDNTTNIDWENIQLSLVTGKPVSFKYDLHTPLYVDRPWISRSEQGVSLLIAQSAIPKTKGRRPTPTPSTTRRGAIGERFRTSSVMKMDDEADWDVTRDIISATIDTATEELGAIVTYQVTKPVTISRSESSLIPLFSKSYNGEQCVVVREDRIDEAMDALAFKKTLELEKGVGTIFIDEIFAGDSMIIRGSDYIAYRLNQDVKLIKDVKQTSKITGINIKNKLMIQKHTMTQKYHFKILNIGDKSIPMFLEIGKMTGYTPELKPTKESANYNRYRFELKPETTEKTFVFTKVVSESQYIRSVSEELVKELIKDGIIDDKSQRIIMKVFATMQKLEDKEKELHELEKKIKFIFKDQKRLRENIKTLQKIQHDIERDAYIQKLKESEQLLETLEDEKKSLAKDISKLRLKI